MKKVLLVSLLLFICSTGLALAAGNIGPDIPPIPFSTSVGLPGANACNSQPATLFLACYIRALYVFFLQAAVVLAVFMIVVGGFQWLMAAGNSSNVGKAKATITGAITGLVLALISYFIFAQINSKLVDFGPIDGLTMVKLNNLTGSSNYDPNFGCSNIEKEQCDEKIDPFCKWVDSKCVTTVEKQYNAKEHYRDNDYIVLCCYPENNESKAELFSFPVKDQTDEFKQSVTCAKMVGAGWRQEENGRQSTGLCKKYFEDTGSGGTPLRFQ